MKRLGKYTGRVYNEDYDFSNCQECCVCITDEQATDTEFIDSHHLKDIMQCALCHGCPAAQTSKVVKVCR